KSSGDQLYLLQSSDKIPDGRIGYLPKSLGIFLNDMLGKTRKEKNNYLAKTNTGYYFKMGINIKNSSILTTIATILDVDIDSILKKILDILSKDKNNVIFTSLNNGDLKTQFKSKENYMSYLKNSSLLDLFYIYDILSIPKVVTPNGVNFIIFQKIVSSSKKEINNT